MRGRVERERNKGIKSYTWGNVYGLEVGRGAGEIEGEERMKTESCHGRPRISKNCFILLDFLKNCFLIKAFAD